MPKLRLVALLAVSLFTVASARAQSLSWDNNTGTAGVNNGSGNWTLTDANWYDGATNVLWPNDLSTIAQFGGGTPASASTVTLAGTINAGGIDFLPLTGTLVAGNAYIFTGGTLALKDNALIQLGDNTTTGSIFAAINSSLTAKDLTIQKSGGTLTQFVTVGSSASALTGTFTIKGNNGGLFVKPLSVAGLTQLVVESGGTYNVSATGSYSVPLTLAGFGGGTSDYGAVRIDPSNVTLSGPVRLAADADIRTNIDTANTVLSGEISELTPGLGFTRLATSGLSVVTFTGTSTFTGATTFGRGTTNQGGINVFDFAAAGAPGENLFYHGVATPGALNLAGGTASTTSLVLRGAASIANSQSFGNLTVTGVRSSVTLTSGTNGSMSLALGTITRTNTASNAALLSFAQPASGVVTTTSPDGFVGPWATQVSPVSGGSWVAISGGVISGFSGDVPYVTNSEFASLSASPATTNFRIDGTSDGAVTTGTTAAAQAGTLTFADASESRVLDVGAGNMLKFAASGGLQVLAGSAPVTIGVAGAAGTITSGGAAANSIGQVFLSNFSNNLLTVNSVLANNGSGANTVVLNGSGRVAFTAANLYTGLTTVANGSLEISNNGALGTTAASTLVVQGASLRLNGDLTIAEAMTIAGTGLANDGSLRSVAGNSTINAAVTQGQPSRINVDAGSTLTLVRLTSPATTDAISGGHALTLGGAGQMIVGSRIGISSSALTKDGSGTVTLRGTNVFTGGTNIFGGTLHLDFPNAAVTSNILYNGLAGSALNLGGGTLQVTGFGASSSQSFSSLTSSLGASKIAVLQNGSLNVNVTFTTFSRTTGGLLDLTLPTLGAITTTGGGNNAIVATSGVTFATIDGMDWAATDSTVTNRKFVGLSSIAGGYTASTVTTLGGNANIAPGITTTTLASSTAVTSLRFNEPQATSITQSGSRTLTTGGILVTPAVGENLSTIAVSTLRTAATGTGLDLAIVQNNPSGDLLISSAITANSGANALTKAGPGKVILTGTNTYAGATRIFDGALQLGGGSLATTTDVSLGSGASSGKFVLGRDVAVNSTVNSLQVIGWGVANAIVGGAADVSTLTLGGSGTSNFLTGTLGGAGANENNLALTVTAGLVQLGGNNTYTGPTTVSGGTLSLSGALSGTTEVNLTGGTLLLAGSDLLNDATTVTLAGGTFSTGGFSEGSEAIVGLGNMNLTATTTLDFGSGGGSALLYAGVGSHSDGAILAITNWTGTADTVGTTTSDRLLFAGLSSTFASVYDQSEVTFNGTPGYATKQYDESHFEIVAIPDPGAINHLAAASLLGLAVSRARRRMAGR